MSLFLFIPVDIETGTIIEEKREEIFFSKIKKLIQYVRKQGDFDIIVTNNPSLSDEKLTAYLSYLKQFNLFKQKYRVDYCKGIVLSGCGVAVEGYEDFKVVKTPHQIDDIFIPSSMFSYYEEGEDISQIVTGGIEKFFHLFICNPMFFVNKTEVESPKHTPVISTPVSTSNKTTHTTRKSTTPQSQESSTQQRIKLLKRIKIKM